MDAISFVMGVRTRHLRSENLKELIYDADSSNERRKARVTLVYEVTGDEPDLGLDIAPDSEMFFSRSISASGVSSYRFNEKDVTWAQYDVRLKSIGVLVKARNFLVFQGDVESVASKDPKQMTAFFEQISGSEDMVEEYSRLLAEKQALETDTISTFHEKRLLTLEKKQAVQAESEHAAFTAKEQEVQALTKEYYLWELLFFETQREKLIQEQTKAQEALEDAGRAEEVVSQEVAKAKQQHAIHHKATLQKEKEVANLRKEMSLHEPESIKEQESVAHLETKLNLAQKNLQGAKDALDTQTHEVKGLEQDIERIKQEELTAVAQQETPLKELTEAQWVELEVLKETARMHTLQRRAKLTALERDQETDQERLEFAQRNADQLDHRLTDVEKELEGVGAKKASMQTNVAELQASISAQEIQLSAFKESLQKDLARRTECLQELDEARDVLRNARAQQSESKREQRLASTVLDLQRNFEGVRGRLVDLVQPSSDRYSVALETALGKHMDSIVVDTEKAAFDCVGYMRDRRGRGSHLLAYGHLEAAKDLPPSQGLAQAVQVVLGCAQVRALLGDGSAVCDWHYCGV